jgi:L-alanine-DL-glutamate epimerase-like enolase superfamily enzyme
MKVIDGKVNICCRGRNFVTLKLTTEDGVYGLGDARLNGRLAVASRASVQRAYLPINRKLDGTVHTPGSLCK